MYIGRIFSLRPYKSHVVFKSSRWWKPYWFIEFSHFNKIRLTSAGRDAPHICCSSVKWRGERFLRETETPAFSMIAVFAVPSDFNFPSNKNALQVYLQRFLWLSIFEAADTLNLKNIWQCVRKTHWQTHSLRLSLGRGIHVPYLSFLVPVKNEFVTTISPAVHLK